MIIIIFKREYNVFFSDPVLPVLIFFLVFNCGSSDIIVVLAEPAMHAPPPLLREGAAPIKQEERKRARERG